MPGTVLGVEDSRHLRWDPFPSKEPEVEQKQQDTVRALIATGKGYRYTVEGLV